MGVMDNCPGRALSVGIVLATLGSAAQAATLVEVESQDAGFGAGTSADASFVTGAENNDSSPGGPADDKRDLRNTLDISVTMGTPIGGTPYIDLIFIVESVFDGVTGITEYAVTQALMNDTGTGLTGITYQLGFGTGTEFLDNLSSMDDGLSFDMEIGGLDTPLPNSDAFQFCEACSNSNEIVLDSGALASGDDTTIEFQLDLPDLFFERDGFNIPAEFLLGENPETGFRGGYTFTLRQTPTFVPVPAALWLFASGLGLAAWFRRR